MILPLLLVIRRPLAPTRVQDAWRFTPGGRLLGAHEEEKR